MSRAALIGREDELAAIGTWFAAASEGSSAFVLEGEPGIGKTVLWQSWLREAAEAGTAVLAHRSTEAEAGLAFTGLSDVIEPVFDDVARDLLPPRRAALDVALLRALPGDAPPDARAIGLAVRDALILAARRRPVIVALDDIQWLDPSSSGVLATALRRIRDEPVHLFATLRTAPGVTSALPLQGTFSSERLQSMTLAPLDVGAVHKLLSERLGLELPRHELDELLRISGGNPYFALELARERSDVGFRRPVDQPMRIPTSLRELLGARLLRLPDEVLRVLMAAASLPQPTVELVCAGHGDRRKALDGLEIAARTGVVELESSNVRFAHPLLASLCYEHAVPWERREVHARLATASADVEQRARHLALSRDGPDEEVASQLDDAAQHAAGRGATAAGAELADLAVLRTPADATALPQRRAAAAGLHHLAGDFARAMQIYEALLDDVPAGRERADLLYAIAELGTHPLPARATLLEESIAHAHGDDGRLTRILGLLAIVRWLMGDIDGALNDARTGLAHAESVGDAELLAMALARVGHIEGWALEVTPGLLERGMAIERTLARPLLFHSSPTFMYACLLYDADELERSREMLRALEAAALARGDEHTRLWILLQWPRLDWYTGRWERGLQDVKRTAELAEQTDEVTYLGLLVKEKARFEADLGQVAEARASAQAALQGTIHAQDQLSEIQIHGILGRLELSLGNVEAAHAPRGPAGSCSRSRHAQPRMRSLGGRDRGARSRG